MPLNSRLPRRVQSLSAPCGEIWADRSGATKPRAMIGSGYLDGIDEPTARFLQTVAWETVQDYYQK